MIVLALTDAHRHLGVLPAWAFYGGPPINADIKARDSLAALMADLDAEGTERALVIPNYGVPDISATFALNDLVVDAAQASDRVIAGVFASVRAQDVELNQRALALAAEPEVKALKISFLLGGHPQDETCAPQLDAVFSVARDHDLTVHVHTSPGAASDIDAVGALVDRYADDVRIHLVHLGGGMSGHMKLIGGRFFDWIEAGKKIFTDTSWAIGFAPRWLAAEIERRGVGHDRVVFASDEPWGDHAGEFARLQAAVGDGELARHIFTDNFAALYD